MEASGRDWEKPPKTDGMAGGRTFQMRKRDTNHSTEQLFALT
jgi:hypothetical protein